MDKKDYLYNPRFYRHQFNVSQDCTERSGRFITGFIAGTVLLCALMCLFPREALDILVWYMRFRKNWSMS